MKLHLATHFHVFEADLWDNRTDTILRPRFCYQFGEIKTTAQLKATLRGGPRTWPGCYPLYFITHDGCALSFDSVFENIEQVIYSIRHNLRDGWRVIGCDVNYEDGELTCEHSGKRIPSAYAD